MIEYGQLKLENNNIFVQTRFKIYDFKEEIDINQRDINDFIYVCINI